LGILQSGKDAIAWATVSCFYRIVKKYRGDIVVKFSELGRGTTIEIVFPICQQEEIKDVLENEREDKEVFTVLWVDDDATKRENVCELLEFIGLKCENANSGNNALEYLNKYKFDFVFVKILICPN
jgi:PleD family two-component response regulator